MKLIFQDLTTPQVSYKCGVDPGTALGVGGLGLMGSFIQGEYSSANVDKQLGAQKEENQKNRDWQTEQAEINRQFQQGMLNQQNAFQTQLQSQQQRYNIESMNKQAQFNSPVYQRQQLEQAHLNPQVYFGSQSSFTGSSAVSGGSPSAQGAPSGSMPGSVGGLSPVGYQPPNLQLGQILKDIAEARKSMSETKTNDLMRDPMYKEVMSKVKNQELVNRFQELSNFVFNETKNAKVQHAFVELAKAEKDCVLADDQHKLNAAEQRYKEAQTSLARASEALQGTEALLFGLKCDTFYKDFESELAVRRSEITRNQAQASESTATAEQTRIFSKLYSDKRYQHSLVTEAVERGRQAVEQTKISKSQAEQMTYLVQQAAYANDMKEFTYWSNQVSNFVGTLGDAATSIYGAGALKALTQIRQGQMQPPSPVRGFTP